MAEFTDDHAIHSFPLTRRPRSLPAWAWDVLGVLGAALVAAMVLVRDHYTAVVRLTADRSVSAVATLAAVGASAVMLAVVGRRREPVGLFGLGLLSLGLSLSWLMLGDHKFAGPVLISVSGSHGVHVGDALAVVPAVVGVLLLAWSVRSLSGRSGVVSGE